MGKYRYVTEHEIKAAPKMLFPYLSTASGLQEWFADKVKKIDEKTFDFIWDKESHFAKVTSRRTNNHIKFVFDEESNGQADGKEEVEKPSFLEFKLSYNELTQSSFLEVIDYSDMDDKEELDHLWQQHFTHLKEVMSGGYA